MEQLYIYNITAAFPNITVTKKGYSDSSSSHHPHAPHKLFTVSELMSVWDDESFIAKRLSLSIFSFVVEFEARKGNIWEIRQIQSYLCCLYLSFWAGCRRLVHFIPGGFTVEFIWRVILM